MSGAEAVAGDGAKEEAKQEAKPETKEEVTPAEPVKEQGDVVGESCAKESPASVEGPQGDVVEAKDEEEEEVDEEQLKRSMDNDQWLRYLDRTDPSHRLRSLCKRGDLDALRAFLESDAASAADVNARCKDGWTSLHEIITHECQFTEVARALVDVGGASVNTQDANGDTPLHSAILYHNADNIKLLLRAGADQSLMNNAGRMPVHVVDDADTLALLLQDGAGNVANLKDIEGNTALHYAVCRKDKDRAISSPKDRDRVAVLLKHSADINVQNHNGSTPLHLTSDFEIARLLLEAGADPNLPDVISASTPLHLAVKGRHKDIVRLMLRKGGGDVALANAAGKTPLNLAKDKEMRNILLGKDATAESSASSSPAPTTPTLTAVNKRKRGPATDAAHLQELAAVVAPACTSPSILKRRRTSREAEPASGVGSAGETEGEESQSPPSTSKPRGPRLRFSEVNDYSGVEVVEKVSRVKAMPIYSEPAFSSDDENA